MADDGGIGAGGDITGTMNTGVVKGVMGGDNMKVDGNIGDGNVSFEGVSGNVALGGTVNAVESDGGNVNIGGVQQNTDTGGGDAVSILGDGNEVTGDQTVTMDGGSGGGGGPAVVNFGDNSVLNTIEDHSDNSVNDSFNTDESVNDSFNDHSDNSDNSDNSFNDHSDHSDNSDNSVTDNTNNSDHSDHSIVDKSINEVTETFEDHSFENNSATDIDQHIEQHMAELDLEVDGMDIDV